MHVMQLNFYSITLLSCADFSLNVYATITAFSNISSKTKKYDDQWCSRDRNLRDRGLVKKKRLSSLLSWIFFKFLEFFRPVL